jgi:hypothetical protein
VPERKSTHSFGGFELTDTVRELNIAGPGGDLLADSKVVWNVRTSQGRATLLASCAGHTLGAEDLISADGTTFGCLAVIGPDTDPTLYYLTYPLGAGTAAAAKARVDYELTHMGRRGVSTTQVMWISPSGDALIGAWTSYAKGTVADAPNGLHIGVMSHGKLTPLRFPAGFNREAAVSSITW